MNVSDENMAKHHGDISYFSILSALMKMNASMKLRITAGVQVGFGAGGYDGLLGAEVSDEFLAQLRLDYPSFFNYSCSTLLKDIQKKLSKIKQIGSSASSSRSIISTSTKRLTRALIEFVPETIGINVGTAGNPGGGAMFDESELQMLRSIYGVDTSQLTNTEIGRLVNRIAPIGGRKKARNDMKKTGASLYKGASETVDKIGDNFKETGSFKAMTDDERMRVFWAEGKYYSLSFDDTLYDNFITSTNDAKNLAQELYDEMIIDDTSTQTPYFKVILDQMEILNTDVIGKDKASGLRKTIGDLCEKQATNKGTSDCRPS